MIERCVRFTCDCCGHRQTIVNPPRVFTITHAVRKIRRRGWKLGKRVRCRLCATAKKEPELDLFAELFEKAEAAR